MGYRRARNLDKNLVFAEYFNSEQEVRRNGGVPTDVVFDKGMATFNGSSSDIILNSITLIRKGQPGSLRVRFASNDKTANNVAVGSNFIEGNYSYIGYYSNELRLSTDKNTLVVYSVSGLNNDQIYDVIITLDPDNLAMKMYVDGSLVATDDYSAKDSYTLNRFGKLGGGTARFDGDIELFQCYNKVLTAEEVSNLYNDARYVLPQLNVAQQLGADLNVSNCENDSYDSFDGASATGFHAVYTTSGTQVAGTADEVSFVSGQKYIVTFDATLTSGQAPYFALKYSFGGGYLTGTPIAESGSNVYEFTPAATTTGVLAFLNNAAAEFTISNLSVKLQTVAPLSPILNVNARSGVCRNLLSGDSIGDNLNVSNCENVDYTTFANATPNGFDATSNGAATHKARTADEIALVSGQKYVVTFDLVLNSGTAPNCDISAHGGGASSSDEGDQTASAGANVFEFTCNQTTTGVLRFQNISTAADYSITNLSVKKYIPEVTNTDIEVVKEGSIRVPRFNGSTSKIDCGGYHDLTGDITIIFWMNPYSYGGGNYGRLLENGQLRIYIREQGGYRTVWISSDGGVNNIYAAADSYDFHHPVLFIITRTSTGVTYVYKDGELFAQIDTDTGTPVAGSTNIILGNISTDIRSFDGLISEVILLEGLMTAAEISQYYTATKHLYGK